MAATIQDITIDQGADYEDEFIVLNSSGNPVDITGAIIAMQIRTSYVDPTALITLQTSDGSLAINGPEGSISLPGLNAALTTAMTPGSYVYDMKMLDANGHVTRPFQGAATVSAEVTTVTLSPGSGDVLLEDGGIMLKEDGSKILTES